ncbi:MAG: lysozyme [Nitrospira sp.]|nr:lysozyme [Nitrospira sp.]
MKTNRDGIELIKSFEGCKLKAYKCPAGIWTVGYGHTSSAGQPKVTSGMTITQAQAEEILVADLATYEAAVAEAITRFMNENQFAAMVSLCFNIGAANFRKSSVCRYFNDGLAAKAANSFLLWNKASGKAMKGLLRRRAAEMALYNKPVQAIPKPVQPDPTIPDPVTPYPPVWPPSPAEKPAMGKPSIQWVMGLIVAAGLALAAWFGFG